MTRINCSIEGTSPLLCNKFTDAAAIKATAGSGSSAAAGSRGTPLEQATERLYVGASGKLMIPQPNLFRCIIDAGKFFKAGRKQITTKESSLIPACLAIPGVEIQIKHKDPWQVDTRAVRNPSTGGRFLYYRPSFNDWVLDFELELDEDIINIKLLREIVDAAGKRVGLGDFRPDRKGPFGKFVVVKWTVQEEKKAKRAT
jgi:hypothetical protein